MNEFYTFRNGEEFFEKFSEDKDKYIVITCAKQENDYIKEWIDYHLNLGFDKIMIGDNNEENDESLNELLQDYVKNNKVQIFNMRGKKIFMSDFYNMFTQNGNYKWAAIIDVDEFIELNTHDNIKNFLKEKEEEDYIELNWVLYSNDGKINKEKGDVQDRFIYPFPLLCQENFTKKTILNGKFKTVYHVHTISNTSSLYCKEQDYTEAYIKHYKYKSIEEQFAIKYRGSGCMTKYIMDVCNFDEIIQYHNLLLKLIDMRHFVGDEHKNDILNYEVIAYNINSEQALYDTMPMILKDMQYYNGKHFVINYKNGLNIPNNLFNLYFEYALHSGNKVSMKFPNIHNFNYIYLYYNYE